MSVVVKDHKGIAYKSEREMCSTYGVNQSTYRSRLQKGFSQEEALCKSTTHATYCKVCKDHNGKEFPSFVAMCQYYGLTDNIVRGRLRRGMSLKDALLRDNKCEGRKIKDHKGIEYPSFLALCRAYNQNHKTVRLRLDRGIDLEHALTHYGFEIKDHLGAVYKTKKAMCEYYDICETVYIRRRKQGWSIQKALETYSTHRNVIMHKYPDILVKEKIFEDDNGIYWGCTCKLCGMWGVWSCADMREHLEGCKREVKVG